MWKDNPLADVELSKMDGKWSRLIDPIPSDGKR
jgi:hypothetical protein